MARLTFPVGDAKALQQAIMSVLHFKDQAQTLVTRGLQQVEAFSWENRARALVAAYAACGGPGESSDARKPNPMPSDIHESGDEFHPTTDRIVHAGGKRGPTTEVRHVQTVEFLPLTAPA